MLLPIRHFPDHPGAKKLEAMSFTQGVMGHRVDPAALERVVSGRRNDCWPEYFAPQNVEESDVAQIFGVCHCVDDALGSYRAVSAGRQQVLLQLGSRVVTRLASLEYVPECRATQVISARPCAIGSVAHRPILGVFAAHLVSMPHNRLAQVCFVGKRVRLCGKN